MQSQEESLCHRVALGWVMNGVALAITFGFQIIESSLMTNNFRAIRIDPGLSIRWLVYLFALHPLMPIFIYAVHGLRTRLFRWVAVAAAAGVFVFFVLHHLSHWTTGQRPYVSSHVLDVTLEVILVWLIVNSVRWARFPRPEKA